MASPNLVVSIFSVLLPDLCASATPRLFFYRRGGKTQRKYDYMNTTRRYINSMIKWMRHHFDLLFWIAALIILFFLPEGKSESSLCVFTLLGFGHCPGCGIGHAIHYALHLNLPASFTHHPMGIPGVIIIFIRIKQLLYPPKQTYEA